MAKLNLNFEEKIFRQSIAPNVLAGSVIFLYSGFAISFQMKQIPLALVALTIIVLIAEFVFSPLTNGILTKNLNQRIQKWNDGELESDRERTILFEDLMLFPLKKAIQTYIYFIVCSGLMAICCHFIPTIKIDWKTLLLFFICCSFGTYIVALFTLTNSESICFPYATRLISDGIDQEYVKEKKHFGLTLGLRTFVYLINPVLYSNGIVCLLILWGYGKVNGALESPIAQVIKVSIISVANISISLSLCILYFKHIQLNTNKLKSTLTNVITTGATYNFTETTLSDKMEYNIHLLNQVVQAFNSLLERAAIIGTNVLTTTENLTATSTEFSSTSNEQSAAVKEISTTMKDSNALSQNISNRIKRVLADTKDTFDDVSSSFEILREIISQMEEIASTNTTIIGGIKNLEQQIHNIGDVVSIITDIADQTRIIAFNAELESVSAGKDGHSFHIVATEIRRLASSTIDSINEINVSIINIQNASANLIEASEGGTKQIDEETKLAHDLEERFTTIDSLAKTTSQKMDDISQIIAQQTISFAQIEQTLNNMSSELESFTQNTKTIKDITANMQQIASNLSNMQEEN